MRRRADLKLFQLEDLDNEEERDVSGEEPRPSRGIAPVPQPAPRRPSLPRRETAAKEKAPSMARDLLVTIKNALDVPAADASGTSDPVCICEIAGKTSSRFETKVIRGTRWPVWDEEHMLPGFEQGSSLLFSVMDFDLGKLELLGKASLSFAQVGPTGLETELELSTPKAPKGSCGKLRVQVDVLDPDGQPYPRRSRTGSANSMKAAALSRTARRPTDHIIGGGRSPKPPPSLKDRSRTWGGRAVSQHLRPERFARTTSD